MKLTGIRKIYYILTDSSGKSIEYIHKSLCTHGFKTVFSWSGADYPEHRHRLVGFSGIVMSYYPDVAEFALIRRGRCVIPVPICGYAISDIVNVVAYSFEEVRTQLEVIFMYQAASDVTLRRLVDSDAEFNDADRKFVDSMLARFDLDAAINGEC